MAAAQARQMVRKSLRGIGCITKPALALARFAFVGSDLVLWADGRIVSMRDNA